MADIVYNRFLYNIAAKVVDIDTDVIRVALVTSAYTPNKDDNTWASLSTYEVSSAGYAANGQQMSSVTWTQTDASDIAVLDAADMVWSGTTIADARYGIIYDDTVATNDLIACIDFGSTKTSSGGDFKITWNGSGILRIYQP